MAPSHAPSSSRFTELHLIEVNALLGGKLPRLSVGIQTRRHSHKIKLYSTVVGCPLEYSLLAEGVYSQLRTEAENPF